MKPAGGKPISAQSAGHAIRALELGSRKVKTMRPLTLRKDKNDPNLALCELTKPIKTVIMVEELKTVSAQVCSFDPASVEEVSEQHDQLGLREALLAIRLYFGLLDHFVNTVIRLHEHSLIIVMIG